MCAWMEIWWLMIYFQIDETWRLGMMMMGWEIIGIGRVNRIIMGDVRLNIGGFIIYLYSGRFSMILSIVGCNISIYSMSCERKLREKNSRREN